MNLKEYLSHLKRKMLKKQDNYSNIEDTIKENEEQLEPKTEEMIKEILDNAIKNFFPTNGEWLYTCFNKPNEYYIRNMPCHLRDYKWLARMLQIGFNLHFISYSKILDYINHSELFNELRHNYELEIVRWQINWMRSGGGNWIVDEDLGGSVYMMSPQCDIAFRKGIVDTLSAIGMDHDVIEEGIEKYATMWRDKYMSQAFYNEFNADELWYDGVEPADNEHKEKWLKMRKFEYYYNHKNSVDRYGEVLPEMMMSDEEAAKLHIYLVRKNAERKAYLDKIKSDPVKKRTLKYELK